MFSFNTETPKCQRDKGYYWGPRLTALYKHGRGLLEDVGTRRSAHWQRFLRSSGHRSILNQAAMYSATQHPNLFLSHSVFLFSSFPLFLSRHPSLPSQLPLHSPPASLTTLRALSTRNPKNSTHCLQSALF